MLTTIGYRAFWGCTALEKISYPVGIVNAGSEISVNCNSLVRVEIPEGVIAVPDRMFENAGISGTNYAAFHYRRSEVFHLGAVVPWTALHCLHL